MKLRMTMLLFAIGVVAAGCSCPPTFGVVGLGTDSEGRLVLRADVFHSVHSEHESGVQWVAAVTEGDWDELRPVRQTPITTGFNSESVSAVSGERNLCTDQWCARVEAERIIVTRRTAGGEDASPITVWEAIPTPGSFLDDHTDRSQDDSCEKVPYRSTGVINDALWVQEESTTGPVLYVALERDGLLRWDETSGAELLAVEDGRYALTTYGRLHFVRNQLAWVALTVPAFGIGVAMALARRRSTAWGDARSKEVPLLKYTIVGTGGYALAVLGVTGLVIATRIGHGWSILAVTFVAGMFIVPSLAMSSIAKRQKPRQPMPTSRRE